MPHGPAYPFAGDERPPICWERPDGGVVGFWPREWLDFLGEAVLRVTDRYDWEVWQPDYRADRIYSHRLDTGVTHRLFPAEDRVYRPGIKRQRGMCSPSMLSTLRESEHDPIVVMLYTTFGFRTPFYTEILTSSGSPRAFPIFFRSGGMFRAPISELLEVHRPLTYIDLLVEHIRLRRLLRRYGVDVISEQSDSALREVRKIYRGRVERLTMGCDFDFWTPAASREERQATRVRLRIGREKLVFFASGNFIPRKQLDRLLEVFHRIENRDDFFLIIAGHGDEGYTGRLHSLAEPLVRQGKAMIHPFVTGEGLRDLYRISDIYASVATDEGGPVSVMKAMACGIPILSTPVGETAGRLKRHGAGRVIPLRRYDKWVTAVCGILDGDVPQALDIATARQVYHWPNVARRFIDVFDDLLTLSHMNKRQRS